MRLPAVSRTSGDFVEDFGDAVTILTIPSGADAASESKDSQS
jgi:hypothetical protein